MTRFKRIVPVVVLLVLVIVAVAYSFHKKAVAPTAPVGDQQNQAQTAGQQPQGSQTVSYEGQDGQTAMVLLMARHDVATKDYSFGKMVTGIDGVTPDSRHFWGFYVNGQLSQVGADAYVTKSTDRLEWKLEEIK
ncbi:MAG: DUF4430 domain-containing protein [Candidatus Saccharibacteria bacterium]